MTPDEIEKDRAPERIWIVTDDRFGRWWWADDGVVDSIKYVRADLFDAVTQERDAALALVAAAYEAASDYAWSACIMCGDTDARAIRALTPADALAAQAARDERMRAEGAREAEARVTVPPAVHDVVAERQRQVSAEGWSPKHDDLYVDGDMAAAAACYALANSGWERKIGTPLTMLWPWSLKWWKPTDRRRDLVKAGALILAEIERLDRAALKGEQR